MYPIGPCVCPAYRAHLEHRLADGVLVVVDEVALAVGHHRSRAPLFVARPPHGARPAADPPSRLCRPLDQGPRAPPLSHVSHSDIASDVICHPDHSLHPTKFSMLERHCGCTVLIFVNFLHAWCARGTRAGLTVYPPSRTLEPSAFDIWLSVNIAVLILLLSFLAR